MNVQADPSVGGAQRLLPFERIALVLQGGGALGAYWREIPCSKMLQLRKKRCNFQKAR